MSKIKTKLNKLLKKAQIKKIAHFRAFLPKLASLRKDFQQSLLPGQLDATQVRLVILTGLIIFAGYFVAVRQYYYENFLASKPVEQKTAQTIRQEILQKDLQTLVKGHPIEAMIPFISSKDRKTAAYIIGIAKKESAWGERKPVLDGEDCFNYWGFRAKRERMGSGGHTCFDSPKDAVDAVAKRIDQIIVRNNVESAKDMIVWKCGSNCAVTGGQAAADKWIQDVDIYAEKILN